jgi:hypothetical protein
VCVRDRAIREQIRDAAYGQVQVTEASLLFVVTADVKAWEKNPQRYWRNAPQEVQVEAPVIMCGLLKEGSLGVQDGGSVLSSGVEQFASIEGVSRGFPNVAVPDVKTQIKMYREVYAPFNHEGFDAHNTHVPGLGKMLEIGFSYVDSYLTNPMLM